MYAPGCENPPRRITTRNSIVEPGERFAIFGDFGERRRDEVLALMYDRDEYYSIRRVLSFYSWTPRRIEWVVPGDTAPGDYALGIVNRLPGRPGTRPVFEHGSNIIRLRIRR